MTMQSRRDLFHAHRLMTQRASLALLRGEPDLPDQPLRRLNVAAFSGVLVAVIFTGLFFIWGLIGHGGSSLQNQPGTLVIDKQTGTPFVFCEGGKLCPVVNYASARLALGNSPLNQQTVDQSALTKFARGPLIGIPGLPQPLPTSGLLVKRPWSVCTHTTSGPFGTQTTTALTGGIRVGGQPLGSGALLATALQQDWVIWDGQRMPIQPNMIQALHTDQTPAQVPSVWLDALPEGPAFAPPPIAGRGQTVTGPTGGPVTVGQVYQVTAVAGSTQYYVLLRHGLAPISQLQAALLDFKSGAPNQATLGPSQVTGHLSAARVPGRGLPGSIPTIAAPAASAPLCVVYSGRGTALTGQVETGGKMPSGGVPTDIPADVAEVTLPPGAGALVGSDPGSGPDSGVISYFLVANGRRYALAETEVAGMLGYNLSAQAVLLPAGVVELIPDGPPLDPGEATRAVAGG